MKYSDTQKDGLKQYFKLENNDFSEKCGKGVRISNSIQCDDGNLVDGDGCSSTCQIEEGFQCSGGSPSSPDQCMDESPLEFEILYVYDQPYDFKVVFTKQLSQESF